MKGIKILVFLFLIIQVFFELGADPLYEGERISRIEFKGLLKTDELSVKSVLTTKPRSLFSSEIIDEDLRALYRLEFFEDIKVDVVKVEEGLIVTFIFTERPTIREVIIKGARRVSERSIKDKIMLKKDSIFREEDVLNDLQNIVKLYEDKGFPNTEVSYEVKNVTKKDKKTGQEIPMVDLYFTVKESRKLIVRSVNFSGLSAVESNALLRVMGTKPRGYKLSAGYFKEGEFELDKTKILKYYADHGYIDARILKVDTEIKKNEEKNREEMDITIYISEGAKYYYGGVDITGHRIFTDEELYPLITLKENDVYNQTKWEKGVQSIRNLLAENGYIYFDMDIRQEKDEKNFMVSYKINITENSKAHVENIFVTGNKKTKDFVIEREIVIREGEIFNARKIQRSQEKLYNLQYFSAVNIDIKPGSELGLVDLIFNVEEQKTGLFTFGLSYSTGGYGLSFFEEVSANNFLGRGLKLYEKVDIGFIKQSVELGIDEPWLFNKPISTGITVSWARTEYGTRSGDYIYTYDPKAPNIDPVTGNEIPYGVIAIDNGDGTSTLDYSKAPTMDYVNNTYKLALRAGHRFLRYYGISSEIAFSVFRNYSESELIPFDESLREQYYEGWPYNWKNYLSITGYRDSRDVSYFATKGSYISQNIAIYGGPLGGYSNFLRLSTDMNTNLKTIGKFVLSSRLNFGFIFPYPGKPLTIDDSDYLRVDTWNEGRGWQHPSQFGSLYSLRGRAELNFSLEYRYPIQERLLWALAFFDISDIYPTPEDFVVDFKDFYYSFGLGMSLVLPGFPIRVYLARRFKYDRTIDKLQFANSQSLFRDWDFVIAVAGFF
ncbi:MAG: outer membrane protein assembly factor BamA [Spirochaetota bacterium]